MYDEELDTPILREQRFRMVEEQLRWRSIHDKRVLEAVKKVPRHLFVDECHWDGIYSDCPVPIRKGLAMHQPYMIGLMMQALDVRPGHKVLEIGTGLGYQAALLGEIAMQVYTLEHDKERLKEVKKLLTDYGYENIVCSPAKKMIGWSTQAPYDRIIVAGAVPCLPKELIKQLSPRGVMVLPVGKRKQEIYRIVRSGDEFSARKIAIVQNLPQFKEHTMTPMSL